MKKNIKRLSVVLIFLLAVLIIGGLLFFIYFVGDMSGNINFYLFGAYMLICLIGITIAFVQRMREIKKGEEEEAEKY